MTDFDTQWLKMRGITQGCAFWGSECLFSISDQYWPQKTSNFSPKWAISSQNAETQKYTRKY